MKAPLLRLVPVVFGLFLACSAADAFPVKPIRLVVPTPPGGTLDFLARPLAAGMASDLKVSVVVDNRGGAGGSIGADLVAKADADGHTVLLADGSALAINTALRDDLPFDAQRDFTPISLVARFSFALLAHPSFPPASIRELVEAARKDPNRVSYASPGIGTPQHLGGAMLSAMAGIQMAHIAYKGAGPLLTDLLGGQVPLAFVGVPPSLAHIRSGKLRALGVSSRQRSPLLPDVPTIAESGYPEFEAHIWFGFFAPARLAPEIGARLIRSVRTALGDPEFRKKLEDQSLEVIGGTPEQLSAYLRSETAKWGALVKSTGAKAQ